MDLITAVKAFQSSPVTKDGRYRSCIIPPISPSVFQSSPVTKDGRYGRPEPCTEINLRFNPRPSLRTGATACGGRGWGSRSVSILARH